MAQTTSQPLNLKLYTEPSTRGVRPPGAPASLPEVLRAFEKTTGWSLQYIREPRAQGEISPRATADTLVSRPPSGHSGGKEESGPTWSMPVNLGDGTKVGQMVLGRPEKAVAAPSDTFEAARSLASAIGGTLGEIEQLRRALFEREAELAAGVPLVSNPDEREHLAVRLQAVLRGGVQAVGCDAAALYLLDEATSKLKLRSCWGLPLDRLTAPPRPLQGAVADLESLLGHAVVLEDGAMMRHWRAPEDFAAAVCVPVSTSTTILGTLWLFSHTKRDFTAPQTNIVEVVAGRLAAEVEREMLWQEGHAAADMKKQIAAADRVQRSQLPTVAPLLDGWDVAGWTAQAGSLGGDFHDWFCLPDGLLAVAVGHAMENGVSAALASSGLKAALRAHGQYCREAQHTLMRLNLTLWTSSAGDQYATLFYGLIETATGRVCTASAGHPGALIVRAGGWESLTQVTPRLGEGPETLYEQTGYELQPGETLALFTDGALEAPGPDGKPLGEIGMGKLLQEACNRSAAEMAALVRRHLDQNAIPAIGQDRSVLFVKRR